ncbi:MAG TPA: 3-deoxy-manno-octulosonate cytidylyltransferase [Candidatus Wunengus sp. YC60]|uniref:3-deoxy-manno-octulosonate cytidylyltransferase n=1 Tax=Candidatus Wunengus sp. YC60 TaxID=3367697 RepID=UPI004027B4EB
MNAVVVIPARYASTRLPGKLILPEVKTVTGKYIIEHVYQNVKQAKRIHKVIVATDNQLIYDIVKGFGGAVEMTSVTHTSGTDRIAEVTGRLDADVIVNVQGDEPEVNANMIDQVIDALAGDKEAVMATLANRIKDSKELANSNVVKVVLDNRGYALYFSRSQIPFVRDDKDPIKVSGLTFLKHLGIYAYRRDFLLKYSKLPPSPLENAEKLEQLRALSNGYKVKVAITNYTSRGIDTREDLTAFMERYKHD